MVGVIYNKFLEYLCIFDDDGVVINVFGIDIVCGFVGGIWWVFVVFILI